MARATWMVNRRRLAVLAGLALGAACGGADSRDLPGGQRGDATKTDTSSAGSVGAAEARGFSSAEAHVDSLGAAADSVLGVQPGGRNIAPARDADQLFLRRMLDHHESVIRLAHEQMMESHSAHGGAADPGALDGYLDAEKREMLAMLATIYGEQYSPVPGDPRRPGMTSAASDSTAPGAGSGDVVVAALRAGVGLVDRLQHHLRRPEVLALSKRLRASQLARIRETTPAPR